MGRGHHPVHQPLLQVLLRQWRGDEEEGEGPFRFERGLVRGGGGAGRKGTLSEVEGSVGCGYHPLHQPLL